MQKQAVTPADLLKKTKSLKSLEKKNHIEMPSLAAYISCNELEQVEKTFEAAQKLGAHTARTGTINYCE